MSVDAAAKVHARLAGAKHTLAGACEHQDMEGASTFILRLDQTPPLGPVGPQSAIVEALKDFVGVITVREYTQIIAPDCKGS